MPVVSEHASPLNQRKSITFFNYIVVSIAHDSNEHVQEHNVGDETGYDKHKPNQSFVGGSLKSVSCEFTETQQVLVHKCVNELITENWVDHLAFTR